MTRGLVAAATAGRLLPRRRTISHVSAQLRYLDLNIPRWIFVSAGDNGLPRAALIASTYGFFVIELFHLQTARVSRGVHVASIRRCLQSRLGGEPLTTALKRLSSSSAIIYELV